MARNEHAFSAEIRKDLENVFKDRIHVNLLPDMRMTGKKCYDFYCVFGDHFTAVETKYIRGESLNFINHFRPHQAECLSLVKKVGGSGLFVIGQQGVSQAFIFSVEVYYQLKTQYGVSFKIHLLRNKEWDNKIFLMNREKVDGKTRWKVETLVYASQTL